MRVFDCRKCVEHEHDEEANATSTLKRDTVPPPNARGYSIAGRIAAAGMRYIPAEPLQGDAPPGRCRIQCSTYGAVYDSLGVY